MTEFGELRVVSIETTGNVHITENTQFNRLKANNVIVAEGVRARLFGFIKESIVLKKGSVVFMHGELQGKIENEGGEIFLFDNNRL